MDFGNNKQYPFHKSKLTSFSLKLPDFFSYKGESWQFQWILNASIYNITETTSFFSCSECEILILDRESLKLNSLACTSLKVQSLMERCCSEAGSI